VTVTIALERRYEPKFPSRQASAKLPRCTPSKLPNAATESWSWSAVKTIPTIGRSAISENTPRTAYVIDCSRRLVIARRSAPRTG
jgi:hypothetical protein